MVAHKATVILSLVYDRLDSVEADPSVAALEPQLVIKVRSPASLELYYSSTIELWLYPANAPLCNSTIPLNRQ